MTSCNGERFVGEQLESFAKQTRKPDELVVCDDRSADRTSEILHDFAKNSPFPVRVVVNEQRLGVTQNFDQAVKLCTGDLIFLSDHDDYWLPEKLAAHESIHQADPGVGLVISNAAICDESLKSLGYTLFMNKRLGSETARRDRSRRVLRHEHSIAASERLHDVVRVAIEGGRAPLVAVDVARRLDRSHALGHDADALY